MKIPIKPILGISAFYHDSAACVTHEGRIIAAAQEERFTRVKHDPSFPVNAIKYVMAESGAGINDLECVAFYDKPFLKFERLLETYHALAPKGIKSFMAAMPVWIKEKIFMRKLIEDELEKISGQENKDKIKSLKLLFPEHHLSHAASAFYPSPFEEAAILTIDGVGEWATSTIGHGRGKDIKILRELDFPHSPGLLYSAFTYYTGFRVNSGEYKLMGLAPYGNAGSERVRRYRDIILERLVDLREDGSLLLNLDYFEYATGHRMCNDPAWEEAFGIPRREPETDISQAYMDMALAIQLVTEEIVMRLARTARALTNSKYLVMAGGVALNCVANGRLLKSGVFDDIWIQPAAGDAGGALGACLSAWHVYFRAERAPVKPDMMQGAYLGPEYSLGDVLRTARRRGAKYTHYENFDSLCGDVSDMLDAGKVVGWFQGRMEWGPRALGGRSILGDPRKPGMQKKLNLKIKYREGFRPFAPAVLAEDASEYFDLDRPSPYMLLVAPVSAKRRLEIPADYENLPMFDRLYIQRSDIQAVTHVDFSARIQTVHKETNERFWRLLTAFKEKTACSVLVNTSFNVRGEPIVCTPDDAYRCFMRTEMDCLVMGDVLFLKEDQPPLADPEGWRKTHSSD